jgi:hypothetical protein
LRLEVYDACEDFPFVCKGGIYVTAWSLDHRELHSGTPFLMESESLHDRWKVQWQAIFLTPYTAYIREDRHVEFYCFYPLGDKRLPTRNEIFVEVDP